MDWTPVESHQIKEVGWDGDAEKPLGIRFHPDKKQRETGIPHSEYHYANVSKELHEAFLAAESKGKWLEANIKAFPDAFPYARVQ